MPSESALVLSESHLLAPAFEALDQRRHVHASNSKSANTKLAYQKDFRDFAAWCESARVACLPATPDTVARYITDIEPTHKPSTLRRKLSSISMAHQTAGYETPTKTAAVRLVMQGIERTRGTAPHQKVAAVADDLARMLDALPGSIRSGNPTSRRLLLARDRALLLVGFSGAFRRSELVALQRSDVDFKSGKLILTLRRSKTDQRGEGRQIGIEPQADPLHCPIRALKAWLKESGIIAGPLFRGIDRHGRMGEDALSADGVVIVVKRAAESAGFDPSVYAGHSLRSGFATSAAEAGCDDRSIMKQTGHRSRAMVDRYVRSAQVFDNNASARIRI
jgi:integrase